MRESTLRDILVSYERKRDKAESELEYRIKDVYSQIPEIKSIDDEVSKIGLELAKLVLLNPQDKDSIIAQSKDKMHELKLKKEELLNFLNDTDWNKYNIKATNKCRHINKNHIIQRINEFYSNAKPSELNIEKFFE